MCWLSFIFCKVILNVTTVLYVKKWRGLAGGWWWLPPFFFFEMFYFFFCFKIFIFNEDAYLRNKIEMHASIRKDLNNVGYYKRKWMTNSYGTALLWAHLWILWLLKMEKKIRYNLVLKMELSLKYCIGKVNWKVNS